MKALFVGRFQPFHIGHLNALEYVSRVADKIIIAIGSSKEKNTLENPFSYKERLEMIKKSLTLDKDKYVIKPVPDFRNNKLWIEYILENFPEFDVVYTSSPKEKKIFRNAHITVRSVSLYNRSVYTATDIRRKMSAGEKWEHLVPKGTASVIKKVKGVKRIEKLVLS